MNSLGVFPPLECYGGGPPRANTPTGQTLQWVGAVTFAAVRLSDMTWPDAARPVLCIPVGSCEQHGPHLPLATDTIVAEALAATLADRRADVVVGPTITVRTTRAELTLGVGK